MVVERKMFFGSHLILNDIIKEQNVLEKDIFKIALRNYMEYLDNQTPIKSFFESIDIRTLILSTASLIGLVVAVILFV